MFRYSNISFIIAKIFFVILVTVLPLFQIQTHTHTHTHTQINTLFKGYYINGSSHDARCFGIMSGINLTVSLKVHPIAKLEEG